MCTTRTRAPALRRPKRIFSNALQSTLIRSSRSQIFCLRGWCSNARSSPLVTPCKHKLLYAQPRRILKQKSSYRYSFSVLRGFLDMATFSCRDMRETSFALWSSPKKFIQWICMNFLTRSVHPTQSDKIPTSFARDHAIGYAAPLLLLSTFLCYLNMKKKRLLHIPCTSQHCFNTDTSFNILSPLSSCPHSLAL